MQINCSWKSLDYVQMINGFSRGSRISISVCISVSNQAVWLILMNSFKFRLHNQRIALAIRPPSSTWPAAPQFFWRSNAFARDAQMHQQPFLAERQAVAGKLRPDHMPKWQIAE
jgi:hypothetical protein